jgi:hypothetical protein
VSTNRIPGQFGFAKRHIFSPIRRQPWRVTVCMRKLWITISFSVSPSSEHTACHHVGRARASDVSPQPTKIETWLHGSARHASIKRQRQRHIQGQASLVLCGPHDNFARARTSASVAQYNAGQTTCSMRPSHLSEPALLHHCLRPSYGVLLGKTEGTSDKA